MVLYPRRPVRRGDEDFLVALHALTLPPGLPPPLVRMQYLAELSSYIQNFGASGHEIISHQNAPIGRWWVHRSPAEIRLVDIRLLPSARGQGIASLLIRELQAESNLPIHLSVAITNPDALRLYQRLDFTVTRQSGMHLQMQWLPPAG